MTTTILFVVLIIIAALVFAFRNRLGRNSPNKDVFREPYKTLLLLVVLASAVIILTNIYDETYLNKQVVGAARLTNTVVLIYGGWMLYQRKRRKQAE